MKKRLLAALIVALAPFCIAQPAGAVNLFDGCDGISGNAVCDEAKQPGDKRAAAGESIGNIINGFLYITGAIAIIMIVYGGFRLLISRGDANAVQSAKNTILYAVLGLAIALLSFAIVNFIGGKL